MIIALVSQKGGVGMTSLATSIAGELSARGAQVLVVDGDPQGTARRMGEVAAERGVTVPSTVVLGKDMFRPHQLPRLARGYEHVVIDTPPTLLGGVQGAALMLADIALVPVSHSGGEVWSNDGTLELIEKARAIRPTLKSALLFVRKVPNTALAKKWRGVLEQSGLPVFATEITFRIAWQEAMTAGQGVAQYAPKDKAAKELRSLIDELLVFGLEETQEVVNG